MEKKKISWTGTISVLSLQNRTEGMGGSGQEREIVPSVTENIIVFDGHCHLVSSVSIAVELAPQYDLDAVVCIEVEPSFKAARRAIGAGGAFLLRMPDE